MSSGVVFPFHFGSRVWQEAMTQGTCLIAKRVQLECRHGTTQGLVPFWVVS